MLKAVVIKRSRTCCVCREVKGRVNAVAIKSRRKFGSNTIGYSQQRQRAVDTGRAGVRETGTSEFLRIPKFLIFLNFKS